MATSVQSREPIRSNVACVETFGYRHPWSNCSLITMALTYFQLLTKPPIPLGQQITGFHVQILYKLKDKDEWAASTASPN
jgi:hypothetical protein